LVADGFSEETKSSRKKAIWYRLEIYGGGKWPPWKLHDQNWTESNQMLEVVNENGISTVWDELFDMDSAVYAGFQSTVEGGGISAFLDGISSVTPLTRH